MTIHTDWDYALESARGHSAHYANALVQVLDTAWAVEAYLKAKDMPADGPTIARLTALVHAREELLKPQEEGRR